MTMTTTITRTYQVGPNAPEGAWVGWNEHHARWAFGFNPMGLAFTSDDGRQWTSAIRTGVIDCTPPDGTPVTFTVERTESHPSLDAVWDRVEKAEARAKRVETHNASLRDQLRAAIRRETRLIRTVTELHQLEADRAQGKAICYDADGVPYAAGGQPRAGVGAALIAAERRHAIEECGFDAAHDAQHTVQQLEAAARAYLTHNRQDWPFGDGFNPDLSYRRRLIVAGQFIAAALDRLALTGLHPTTDSDKETS